MKKKFLAVLIIILSSTSITSCSVNHNENPYNHNRSKDNVVLGLTYLRLGDKARAKEKLLRAVDETPQDPVALDAMAYFWEQTGNDQFAADFYRRAYTLAPQEGAVLNNYGVFLCKHREYQKAEELFTKAENLQNYINTSKVYENAGLCALMTNDKAKAKDYFTKALAN